MDPSLTTTPPSPTDFRALVERTRKASEILKSLSHETRLLILCILADGEKSVSELEALLAMPQAAVSQQLARLRYDQLVTTRRDGRTIFYSIAGDSIGDILEQLQVLIGSSLRSPSEGDLAVSNP